MSWKTVDDEMRNLWKAIHVCLSFASLDDDIAEELMSGSRSDELLDKAFELLGLAAHGNPGGWTVAYSDCHARLIIMPSANGLGLNVLVPMRPRDLEAPALTRAEINQVVKNNRTDLVARLAAYYDAYVKAYKGKKVGPVPGHFATPNCSYGCHHETTGPLPADFNRRC